MHDAIYALSHIRQYKGVLCFLHWTYGGEAMILELESRAQLFVFLKMRC
jgi:hypothetical protein